MGVCVGVQPTQPAADPLHHYTFKRLASAQRPLTTSSRSVSGIAKEEKSKQVIAMKCASGFRLGSLANVFEM